MYSEPKTDWESGDIFECSDYNRIKNNINYLKEQAELFCAPIINFEDMGTDKTYTDFYYADEFNKFENNLDSINKVAYSQDIGLKQTFYDNGAFISSSEINRLENACRVIKNMLDAIKKSRQRLPFTLGNYKGIRF